MNTLKRQEMEIHSLNVSAEKKVFFLIFFIGLFTVTSFSQEVFHFKKGLVASVPSRYGREAIYTDRLAYELYTKTLKTPTEGAVWGKAENGEDITWQPVEADSANRLFRRGSRGGFGRGGYMYLTYHSGKERPALLNVRGNSSLFFNGELHAGDPYNSGWLYLPVKLKKGLNEIYVRGTFAIASLTFPTKPVLLNIEDPTVPSL
ncbi:MAG TPA: hypothetical protein VGE06_02250, partial [Flavisolibacter sp.]